MAHVVNLSRSCPKLFASILCKHLKSRVKPCLYRLDNVWDQDYTFWRGYADSASGKDGFRARIADGPSLGHFIANSTELVDGPAPESLTGMEEDVPYLESQQKYGNNRKGLYYVIPSGSVKAVARLA